MSKERFLSDVRTARTFSDTKFAQSLTWANKEILRLTAALESANQRAEEADMKRASLSFTSKEQVDIFNRVVKKNEYLEAELADKEGEIESLRDRLRWMDPQHDDIDTGEYLVKFQDEFGGPVNYLVDQYSVAMGWQSFMDREQVIACIPISRLTPP